jgi:hypothetical protein
MQDFSQAAAGEDGPAFDRLTVDPDRPPIRVVRQLLLVAFGSDPGSLRRFCEDRPVFRELRNRFGLRFGLDDMVDEVITFCGTDLLWDDLLAEVAAAKPGWYAHFEDELRGEPGVAVDQRAAIPRGREAGVRDARPQAGSGEPAGPLTEPIRDRWALLVGVNRYVEPAFPSLKYCVKDVLALAEALKGLGYTVVALHDEAQEDRLRPTRENVEAELARLCQVAGPDDLLWAHFACHGKLVDGQPLLVTHETRAPTLARRALPLAEVEAQMRGSRARRLVLTLDACHTGVEVGRDIADPEFIKNVHDLAEGFALIAASTAQQVAQEWEEKQHGVFTYYLLEGLSGRADHEKKGLVTVDDLAKYVLHNLRQWNVEHGGLLQEPNARTEMIGDMILADYRVK